jgi:alpha-beta hydrolase superfamily lysophospholipase
LPFSTSKVNPFGSLRKALNVLVDLLRVTTRDGCQLDGMLQRPSGPNSLDLDAVCLVHGTGGNFYGSALFETFSRKILDLGCSVVRVNTRGHDGISTAVTGKGGVRLGAAYETVDDCRHDLASWLEWTRANLGPRVALLGHSLGAVKCLYAAAHEPASAPQSVVAVSPPRLSYSWFCSSSRRAEFLATYEKAEELTRAGQGGTLVEVKLPLPMAIAAAGYVEKYGPEERYNYLRFLGGVPCPTVILLGEAEVANNMAFQEAPAELARLAENRPLLTFELIAGADHFYSGVREQAWQAIEKWLANNVRLQR